MFLFFIIKVITNKFRHFFLEFTQLFVLINIKAIKFFLLLLFSSVFKYSFCSSSTLSRIASFSFFSYFLNCSFFSNIKVTTLFFFFFCSPLFSNVLSFIIKIITRSFLSFYLVISQLFFFINIKFIALLHFVFFLCRPLLLNIFLFIIKVITHSFLFFFSYFHNCYFSSILMLSRFLLLLLLLSSILIFFFIIKVITYSFLFFHISLTVIFHHDLSSWSMLPCFAFFLWNPLFLNVLFFIIDVIMNQLLYLSISLWFF